MGAIAALFLSTLAPTKKEIEDYHEHIQFSEKGFFLYILPPIIFAAGYTLKKKNFIRQLATILSLGVFGTIIAMVIISLILLHYNNQYKWL